MLVFYAELKIHRLISTKAASLQWRMSLLKQNIILVSRIPKWNRNKTGGVEGGKKNAIQLTEKVNKETYELSYYTGVFTGEGVELRWRERRPSEAVSLRSAPTICGSSAERTIRFNLSFHSCVMTPPENLQLAAEVAPDLKGLQSWWK